MKDLAKLLKKRNKPPGTAPKEWLLAAKLPVSSGYLFIGDPNYDPADAYVATVPPGTYSIEARLRDLGQPAAVPHEPDEGEGLDEARVVAARCQLDRQSQARPSNGEAQTSLRDCVMFRKPTWFGTVRFNPAPVNSGRSSALVSLRTNTP